MRFLLALVAGAALTLALLSADSPASQIAAERTAQVQAQEAARTERLALQEAARTERAAERAATLQYAMMLLVVVVVVVVASTAAVVVAVQVLRQRSPAVPAGLPQPSAAVVRVAARPGHRLEYDSVEGWIVVLPGDREYYTEQDARRLLNG